MTMPSKRFQVWSKFFSNPRNFIFTIPINIGSAIEFKLVVELMQCQYYWYTHTQATWEASKKLFHNYLETTQSAGRSRYLGFKIDKAGSVENAAEEKRKAKEEEVRQGAKEQARCQAELTKRRGKKRESGGAGEVRATRVTRMRVQYERHAV
ncbi:hypothetical protein BDR04DRAFT_1142271 [Suillus decipiens]|nr:hypothetical protein BDR04DRAFT_1142271 [Suillus decipiens]